jgi:serine/threonine protein kinase
MCLNCSAFDYIGTLGYLAPELTITGKATDKTDVFSFGALCLEVACGRRPIVRSLPPDEVVLVDWVWALRSKGEMMSAVDPRLPRGQFPLAKVAILLNVGLLCSHPDPAARPSMRQVVRVLKSEDPCPAVPDSKPTTAFAIFQRNPSVTYSSPPQSGMRSPAVFSRPSSNKISGKTQSSRVAPSS